MWHFLTVKVLQDTGMQDYSPHTPNEQKPFFQGSYPEILAKDLHM